MLSILDNSTNFSALSVKDLLTARDRYHDLLLSKKNVIATAIGLYRIRRSDRQDDRSNREGSFIPGNHLGSCLEAGWGRFEDRNWFRSKRNRYAKIV